MQHDLSLNEIKKEYHGTLKSYVIGFITSLVLTGVSFSLVTYKLVSGHALIYSLVALALTQAICQLLFFLHLGREPNPKWETAVFFFMLLILFIIILGSLWVMNDLNERMMPDMHMMKHGMTHD